MDPKDRLTYLVYRTLGTAMELAPEPLAQAAAAVVGEALARRRGPTRRFAEAHLRRVLASSSPGTEPDPELVRRWARRSFRSYARYWAEGASLPATAADVVLERMSILGYDHLERGLAAGRGVVLALPHIGSWEWGGTLLALDGKPMTAVAEQIEPPELFDWFIAKRQQMGLQIVALGPESGSAVLRTLRSGGLVGLLCDRDLVGNGVEVDFFGERTTLPGGPATVALRTGAALMVAVVYSGPGQHHTAVISPPLDTARTGGLRADVERLTQQLADQLAAGIRRAPEQWHLFQPNWPSDAPAATCPAAPGA